MSNSVHATLSRNSRRKPLNSVSGSPAAGTTPRPKRPARLRHLAERLPKTDRCPLWHRELSEGGGLTYSLYLPTTGRHIAFTRVEVPATSGRRTVAEALRAARKMLRGQGAAAQAHVAQAHNLAHASSGLLRIEGRFASSRDSQLPLF